MNLDDVKEWASQFTENRWSWIDEAKAYVTWLIEEIEAMEEVNLYAWEPGS